MRRNVFRLNKPELPLQRSGLQPNNSELPPLPWLDSGSALHILRIVQEVLTNIIKHSGATRIAVGTHEAINGGLRGVEIVITDNGRPFHAPPPEATPPARRGLSNIRSRAQALGAWLDWVPLDYGDEGGTRFRMWLPLAR